MLGEQHLEAMKKVVDGGTVYGYKDAKLLREVQQYDRELIHIIDKIAELEEITGEVYDGAKRLPYFGAILSEKGKQYLKELNVI